MRRCAQTSFTCNTRTLAAKLYIIYSQVARLKRRARCSWFDPDPHSSLGPPFYVHGPWIALSGAGKADREQLLFSSFYAPCSFPVFVRIDMSCMRQFVLRSKVYLRRTYSFSHTQLGIFESCLCLTAPLSFTLSPILFDIRENSGNSSAFRAEGFFTVRQTVHEWSMLKSHSKHVVSFHRPWRTSTTLLHHCLGKMF